MKIITTDKFKKTAGSWDDQPNFWRPRHQKNQPGYIYYSGGDGSPDNEEDVEKRFEKKKKKKKKIRKKKARCFNQLD